MPLECIFWLQSIGPSKVLEIQVKKKRNQGFAINFEEVKERKKRFKRAFYRENSF